MTVERLKKISIVTHRCFEDQVVETLTRLGTVHLEKIHGSDYLACKQLSEEEEEEVRRFTFELSKVDFLLEFFRKYHKKKPDFLSTLIKTKYYMTFDEFLCSLERVQLDRVYNECSSMEKRIVSLSERKERFGDELWELQYWAELEIPLQDLRGDFPPHLRTFRIAVDELDELIAELETHAPESSLEVVGRDETWAACILIYHPQVEETVSNLLSEHQYVPVDFLDLPSEPQERLEQVQREIAALERRREQVFSGIEGYGDCVPDLQVIREYLLNQRRKLDIITNFGMTKTAVVIEGWVPEASLGRTAESISGITDEVALEVIAPGDDEIPPVSLNNSRWARPFEVLLNMYGPPKIGEYDPTWVVAISFMVFFGFCISDVGYGLCLVIAFLLARKYLPLGEKAKDFMIVLASGSAWAVLIGVFSGSWFGIELEKLPSSLRSLAFLEGLTKTVLAMVVVMTIGAVHMLIGVGIEFGDNWKSGSRSDALIDQGLVFLMFAGGGITGALAAAKVLPKAVPLYVVLASAIGMVLLLGRSARSIPGKLVNGVYETYGTLVGFISDTISYIRLFALGLATFMIGYVINTMAGMVIGIAPVIGILLMLVILLVGHTFNVAINLLGAFVHPLRLEFVEFFGKFYEGGGKQFAPLRVDSQIVIIRDEENPVGLEKGGDS